MSAYFFLIEPGRKKGLGAMIAAALRSFIKDGALILRLPGDATLRIGADRDEDAPLIVQIRDPKTLMRIARNPQLAVGEAYMDGTLTIERGTLYEFLELAARNARHLPQRRLFIGLRGGNGRGAARRNVAHHYDLSGELYRLFLDADRQYSCAYFTGRDMSLEEAQAAKKRHLAAKLLLKPGQSVLDVGSGWGGLAITLAQDYGADVTGVTLSQEQLAEARARAERRGLQERVRFRLQDYRDVRGRFDRIVSVGMFEHVGPEHYRAFFDMIAARLDPMGVAVLHTIGQTGGPGRNNPWIDKYIFPGGEIPALSQIAPAIEQAGLILTDLEVLRLHYADTLRAWRVRFERHREEVRALYDERFCRMWEFYLAGAEAGFRAGDLVVFQLQLAKDRAAVPITRDYITDFDRAKPSYAVAAE
jgi:cyclopropane-fatty-acyl-phospholipid synthase